MLIHSSLARLPDLESLAHVGLYLSPIGAEGQIPLLGGLSMLEVVHRTLVYGGAGDTRELGRFFHRSLNYVLVLHTV